MNALMARRFAQLCWALFVGASVQAQTITVMPTPMPQGSVGGAYSTSFSASGGTAPYRFSVERGRLPNGMSLTEAGVLSGTPTRFATVPFEVWVTDFDGRSAFVAASTTLLSNLLAIDNMLPAATLNSSYTPSIRVSGGGAPYSCTLAGGSLPPGVSLNANCTLSGSPTTGGTFTFSVTVTDGFGGSGTQSFTVTVSNALGLSLAATSGTVGMSYGSNVVVSGGTAPYTCSLTSGALPPGLALASTCVLAGVPLSAGNFSFTVTASDNFGGSGSRSFAISIAAAAPVEVSLWSNAYAWALLLILLGAVARKKRLHG